MKKKKRKKRHTVYVIFASPEQHRGLNVYFGNDGSITDIPSQVAKFHTFESAQAFAAQHKIELSAVHYIGRAEFSDRDCG